jgi:hypothetical protein
MGIEQLENKGFAFINTENINTEKRQIVVIGTARGGTSLVAGALHHLGVFTGEKSNPPVFEDVLLSEAFENNELDTAKDIVERYSNGHDIWGWKRPGALNYLDKVEQIIPNPFYIFIFKDIFAIANRNSISMQADLGKGLNNALADYSKIVEFVTKTDKPVMLVSAEKALQNKEDFVNALVEMNKDIKDFSSNAEQAVNFIMPNPKDYLDKTRITKGRGNVGRVSTEKVGGWASFLHSSEPAVLELYVDGVKKSQTIANHQRNDLKDKGIHISGQCGFMFDVKELSLKGDELIEVLVKGEVNFLNSVGWKR